MGERYHTYEIKDLKAGDHLCCLYKNNEEHKTLLTSYMRYGLEKNEKVLYIADSHTSDTVLNYLRDDGLEVESYLDSGQLIIQTVNQSYLVRGVFDPDSMINMLSQETEKALQEGYSALRVTGEMSWALKGLTVSERLLEYESKLNEFFLNHKVLAICQYDRRLFESELLLNILLTHPFVIIGTKIYENFYFMPPEKHPFDIPESTLNEWIKSLEVYHNANLFRENILSSMMDGLSVADANGVHQEVNNALCEMTGFSREELIGTGPPYPYWPGEEYNKNPDDFLKTLKGRKNDIELVFKRKNGERFPVIVSPSLILGPNQKLKTVFTTIKDISQRKKAEKIIKQNERVLRAILESSKGSIALVDNSGIFLEVNKATAERFRVKPGEMVGTPIKNYLSPEIFKSRWKYIEKVFKTKEPVEFEDERDGNFFLHSIYPVFEYGEVKKAAVFSQDITKRKISENDLKEAHNKLEATLKAIPDLMFEVDDKGIIYDYYAPESDNLYAPPPEFMGKRVSEILPKDASLKVLKAIDEANEKGFCKGVTYSLHLPTGEKRFELSLAKKANSTGPVLFVAVARDVTERKQNEKALKQALNYNRSLIEVNIDPLVTIGSDGKVTDVNSATESVTGFSREDIIGTDFSDYFTDPEKAEAGYRLVFEEGFVRDYPLEIQHRDGGVTPVIYNASVYRDENGDVLGVFAAARDITELKKIENDLRNSYLYNRSLIEVNIDPLVTIGSDGKVTDVNSATESVTGFSREDIIGTDFSDYFTDPEKAEAGYRLVFEEGFVRDYPLEIQHRDGGVTPVIYNASVYRDENGDVLGVFAAARDITELKRAEKNLSDSQSRLNSILEGTPIPTFVIDKNHQIIYWNKALEEISGILAQDVIGTQNQWKAFYDKKRPSMADMLVDGSKEKLHQWYGDKYKESKFLKEVYEAVDFLPAMGDGGKWLFFTAAPVKDSEGNLIGAVETLEDITESKKAESALKKSEERFRAVAESAVDAIVTTDVHGVIKFFNNSLTTIFGYSHHELTGKPLTILMPPRFRITYIKELKRFQESGEHRLIGKTVMTTGLKRDGTEFPFEMSLSSWKSGEKIFFTSIIRDLTEKKKAEAEIKKQVILTTSINRVLQDSLRVQKDDEVALISLKVAQELTGSKFGFVMEINKRGTVDTIAVNDPGWNECQIPQKEAKQLISGMKIASYWGRVIKQGKSQIVNHPEFDPDSRGVPKGHPDIHSFLGVPLKRGEKTIGLIGLANKEDGYDHDDLQHVETLAVALVEALYNKKAEEKIEKSLKEKEMLLKEIHHRVKNNLSVISSLLNLQSNYIKDKEDLELFRESQTRAKSMALIHERLYQSQDLKRIDFSDYIKTLASDLFRTYVVDPERINLKMDLDTILLDINTSIPLGLILNELLSNAMKYAFPNDEKGEISIKLRSKDHQYVLIVSDNGVGLPPAIDFDKIDSLGLQLVYSLTNQIDGSLELDREHGTKYTIQFQEKY
ncbi:MAG: PAS domain S-box protein [Methanobacterium sp.]|nr:PAS domain S-box protein [Methanobacterium sp.]